MIGGLHIEILLLEIHVQLIAGNEIPLFLNYSKLFITGAGNIALNIPNIVSARYLIQVLAVVVVAMMLLFEIEETFLDFEKG